MMTTIMNTPKTRRPDWASMLLGAIFAVVMLVGTAPDAHANGYGYTNYSRGSGSSSYGGSYRGSYGGNKGGSYHGGGHHVSKPAPAVRTSSSPSRRYHYNVGWRGTGSSYSWLNYGRGQDNDSGYRGPGGGTNTPHRSDWYAKLRDQRRWDEQQFKKAQQGRGGAECGLSGAPAYCYKLQGPYPTEMKIVRY